MADVVTHVQPFQRTKSMVLDFLSTLPAFANAHNVDLDTESDWDVSDILPSGEIDACRSLRADFTVIRDK